MALIQCKQLEYSIPDEPITEADLPEPIEIYNNKYYVDNLAIGLNDGSN